MSALAAGQFISTNNSNYVLFINEIKDNTIHDVYLFQMQNNKNEKPSVVLAEQGKITALPNGDQILNFTNSRRIEGSAVLPDFRIAQFDQYNIYLGQQTADSKEHDEESFSFSQLLKADTPAALAELHWRITIVLAVPLMALIAVPLSRVNPRQGRFAKILPALLLYLIYFLLQSSFKSAGTADKLNATVLMPIVNIVFLLLGIILNSWHSSAMYKIRYFFNQKNGFKNKG